MHLTKAKIAALVLGYLKSEKLNTVVEEFLKCSPHFRVNDENIKMGNFFSTRISYFNLNDCLEQFALISATVQSRLEETSYYDTYKGTTVFEQLLYLLEREVPISASTPVKNRSEVDATPAYSLPGNFCLTESDSSIPKTPKKRCLRSNSKEQAIEENVIDMTEVLTQSLLEKHELHEKIAETINIVMNTPEVTKPVSDEHISAGASKEIDAVIKTVIQRTAEDPVYNKLIDEIIGTTTHETTTHKKATPLSTPPSTILNDDSPKSKSTDETSDHRSSTDPIDDHNNAAIRSIIEAAQNPDPPPPELQPTSSKTDTSGDVYVFDGSLDSYLKTSGATHPVNYFNSNLIVLPPQENPSKQFYIVNNQPLLKMVPTVLTEKELMSLPTVIVNDENTQPTPSTKTNKVVKRTRLLKPKGTEHLPQVTVTELQVTESNSVVTAARPASHVRNLDFSTPSVSGSKSSRVWDADLRQLISGCKDKSPSPKKKKVNNNKKKKSQNENDENVKNEKEEMIVEEPVGLMTPMKDTIPKTPGGMLDSSTSGFHCTPFNDVINDQLEGVDLTSIPTPSIPITPGFALTPGDMLINNQRMTDYSTSSSYYQPSDSEQKVTMCQLIEECERLEKTAPPRDTSVNIISDVVIEQARVPESENKKPHERLKKFNNNVIGKKNLSLIRRSSDSSSSSSDSDDEPSNETVIKNNEEKSEDVIKDIINNVEVKSTLEQEKKNLLSHLETVRQRTVHEIKKAQTTKKAKSTPKTSRARITKKKPVNKKEKVEVAQRAKVTKKKPAKTKDNVAVVVPPKKGDEQNLWLSERGIHLVPTKTPQKKTEVIEMPQENDSIPTKTSQKKTKVVEMPQENDSVANKTRQKKTEDVEIPQDNDKTRQKKTEDVEMPQENDLIANKSPQITEVVEIHQENVLNPVGLVKTSQKKSEVVEMLQENDEVITFDRRDYEDFEKVVHCEKSRKKKKVYDPSVLEKHISANVEIDDVEVIRVLRWTNCDSLLDLNKPQQNDELRLQKPAEIKGRKRKSKCDDTNLPKEKRNKVTDKNLRLLKHTDIDLFLDKVHGE